MNFQQLRYVRAAVQNNLNLTEVAGVLFTSQSGVSKQIKELEIELGIEIFIRRGKRLVGVTPAGERVVAVINSLLAEADNLKRLSDQFVSEDRGRLVIAATHNQARYVIPPRLSQFTRMFPDVEVELRQGSPREVGEMVVRGEADIGIATEAVEDFPELETHPSFVWNHLILAPRGHPLEQRGEISLSELAEHPIITYAQGYSDRSKIDAAFEAAGLSPDIRLTASDSDVIKAYVELGLGIGIICEMALADGSHERLRVVASAEGYFGTSTTRVAVARGGLLRNFIYSFIELMAPHLDPAMLRGNGRGSPGPQVAPLPFDQWRALVDTSPVGPA